MPKKKATLLIALNCCSLFPMELSTSQTELFKKTVCNVCCGDHEEEPRPISQMLDSADFAELREGVSIEERKTPPPSRNYKLHSLSCGHRIHACCLSDRMASKRLTCEFCQQKFDRGTMRLGEFHQDQENLSNACRQFVKNITPRVSSAPDIDRTSLCTVLLCCSGREGNR